MEIVKGLCYLGDGLNASGGCETAVTSKVRIGWIKFRECGELLRGRRFSWRMKEMVYRSCVRSAMLHGSETWCLRESEMTILRRTERAMVRSMCEVKLVDRKNTEKLMEMLDLQKTLDRMAKANGVRWYGHVIRRKDDDVLKKAVMMEVNGQRKRGRPKMTWKRQVEESVKKVGLKIEQVITLSTCLIYVSFKPTLMVTCCSGLDVIITFLNYDIKNLIVMQKVHSNKPT